MKGEMGGGRGGARAVRKGDGGPDFSSDWHSDEGERSGRLLWVQL